MGRECGRTQATGPNKNARRWAIWLRAKETPDKDAVLYLIAKGGEPTVNKGSGDNPAIVLLTVLGGKPPAKVTINELTTVASAFTTARFINGESSWTRRAMSGWRATCPWTSQYRRSPRARPSWSSFGSSAKPC